MGPCAAVSRSAATVQMVCPGGWQRKTSHALRDAHAYMLISIPTATSTIFGAFQVMFSSFRVGPRHVCFPTIACFAWWAHLSTRTRRRNCDQGSRPERRLWRAAEPISSRSNPSQGSTYLRANSWLCPANYPWSNRTPAAAHKVRLAQRSHGRHVAVRLNYDLPPIRARRHCWHFVRDGRNNAASISPRGQP